MKYILIGFVFFVNLLSLSNQFMDKVNTLEHILHGEHRDYETIMDELSKIINNPRDFNFDFKTIYNFQNNIYILLEFSDNNMNHQPFVYLLIFNNGYLIQCNLLKHNLMVNMRHLQYPQKELDKLISKISKYENIINNYQTIK